jgi:GT2 family glycosyltransferase
MTARRLTCRSLGRLLAIVDLGGGQAWRERISHERERDVTPPVSVVVPTHARPDRLASCVRSIGLLDYPVDALEVVVVDDGSPIPVVPETLDAGGRPLRVVRQAHAGPAAARNAGAAVAEGPIVAFVDDDCAPEPAWLARLVRHLEQDDRTVTGGRTVNALAGNSFSEASQALITYLYEYYSARRRDHLFFTTNNLALRKSDFDLLGGFDERFRRAAGEDREFGARCARADFRLVYEPTAIVRHAHDLTLRSFWRQHLAYGRAAHTFHALEPSTGVPRLEPAAFYTRLVLYPSAAALPRPVRTCALLVLSQIANATGYALAAARAARES